MLIREVPIFVLSHKNSRVLEGEGEAGGGGERGGGCGEGEVGAARCVCVLGGGVGRLREGDGRQGWVCGAVGGADGERETGDALSMHGSRKK